MWSRPVKSWPSRSTAIREIAAGLDLLARRADRTVVGAGVNPGFLMDALPASLSSILAQHSARAG